MNKPSPSLRHRLIIGIVSAIMLSLVVSIGGLWIQAALHQHTTERLQRAAQAREATLSLNIALLTEHRHDIALLELAYRNQPIEPLTVVAYITTLQEVRQAFGKLEALSVEFTSLTPFTQELGQTFNTYQATLAQITAQIEQRRHINGIEHRLREAWRALWLTLDQQASIFRERGLRLALEEQAYLTTRRQEYIDGVRIQINQLQAATMGLPESDRTLLQQRLTAYLNTFLQLTTLDRELQQYVTALQYHTDDMLHAIVGIQQAIATEQDQAAAMLNLADWMSYGLILWMIGSSTTIFATLGWFINRHITRPLTTLTYAAKRVTSGWHETPIPIVGTDEIGDLARALAQLTNELNETIAKLEDRVAQRTIQLQRALARNEALLAQERRRSRNEQILIDLSLALSHLMDEAAIYRCVVDTLAAGQEPDDRIGIYTREADGTFWVPQVTYGYQRDPFLKLVAPKALEQAHANLCYIDDLSAYSVQGLPALQGSVVAATILLDQQDYALLTLYRPQPNAFTDDEIAYIGIAARLAGQALTRVQLVGSLQQAKEAAEAINRERSAFLARLDHDVRNPLNTIIAMGEMLREALADRPAASEDAGTIARAGRRLLSRLNILLDSAKIESGMLTLQPEPFLLDTLLDDVLSEIEPLIRQNHNRLEIERPSNLGLIVADLNRLRHSLIHPLRFAAATTRHGAITVQVQRQTTDAQRDVLAVTINDTGATLSERHLQSLLTPFALPSAGSRRADEGQGLALSRQLCELMGGSLVAYPRTSAGIGFTIRIPIVLSHEPDDPVVQPHYWPQPDLVLVTAIEARTLQNALEQVGWQVQRAASLTEAIAQVRRPPSALLIDTTHDPAPVAEILLAAGWDTVPVIWLCHADSGECAMLCARWPGDVEAVIRTVKTVLPRPQQHSNAILLIEDDLPTRLMIRHALESEGWHVIEAGDGVTGKTIWLSAKPALVILDLMLPDGDGLALLHHLRQIMTTPVVVVTAKMLHHDELSALANIGATVLQKGRYRRSDLLALVRTLVR